MLYMVNEQFNPGKAAEIYRRALERGRLLPAGLEYLESWVDLEFSRCFQLMRTDDASLFDGWIASWNDLTDFEVIPVRTSKEAAATILEP